MGQIQPWLPPENKASEEEATSEKELVKSVQSLQLFRLLSKTLSVKAGSKPGCVRQSLSHMMYLTLSPEGEKC